MNSCRLCGTASDIRLMMSVFDETSNYATKIEEYLKIKIPEENSTCICFHCSQTIDNFHNFATKIHQIQKLIFPEITQIIHNPTETEEVAYEICVIPTDEASKTEDNQLTYKVTTIRTKPQKVNEKVFDELRFNETTEIVDQKDQNLEILNSSDEEEPPRDTETDWPSSEALKKIPTKLVENGLLLYKGKKLMQMMSMFYSTKCEICGASFKRITNLFEHYKSHHKTEPFVTCCSTKLSRMPRIIWHFVKHIQPESFKCHICGYAVSRPKFLDLHIRTHTNSKPFSCDLCSKKFIWKGALKSHLINHQPEADRKCFECPQCDRKYQTAGSLASHKKVAHSETTKKTKNLCEVCSKSFATLTSYKEHMITHSADSEKMQIQCGECGKWLKNQRCYKSHIQLHAKVDFSCEICDYVTKKEKLLKNHMITRHTSDRPFACESCDKSFKVKRALTIHKAQAHAENSTKAGKTCEFCGREFASSTNYYTHRKNLHAAELQQMIDKKNEEEKKKRIEIGLE